MGQSVEISVSGDLAAVSSLPKQIRFAAFRTTNDLLDRSQTNVIGALKRGLHIRNHWTNPRTRYGINAKYAKRNNLSGSLGTAADWLLEEEGYNDGVKKPDHASRYGGTPSALSIPDVGNARPTLMSVMPRSQKASSLRNNPKRTKVFVVTSKKTGKRMLLQRVGETAGGELLRDSRGNLRIGRKRERAKTRVVLKAVFQKSVRVPEKHIFVDTAVKTMNVNHYGDRFGKNLINALKTAKSK